MFYLVTTIQDLNQLSHPREKIVKLVDRMHMNPGTYLTPLFEARRLTSTENWVPA